MLAEREKEAYRKAILADPCFLAEHVLGYEVRWFHRLWLEWTVRHPFSMIEGPRGFGKSRIATTAYLVWRIVLNPNVRIVMISKTDQAATAFVREVREILETNEILRQVFGTFVGTSTWRDERLTVAQRAEIYAECTLEARGIGGQLARTHWDLAILDDLQDLDRAESETSPGHDWAWFKEVLQPTIVPGGGIKVRATCYGWDDLRGRIERAKGAKVYDAEDVRLGGPLPSARWAVLKTPAILRDGASLWPERFPLHDRVNEETGEVFKGLQSIRDEDPDVFDRQYQQVLKEPPKKGEEETQFKRAWIKAWDAAPDLGKLMVFMRVDPAFRDAEQAAMRSKRDRDPDFFVIAVVGHDYASGRSYGLDLFRDRLTPVEYDQRTVEYARRWNPRVAEIERTGLQIREAPEFYESILRTMQAAGCVARFGSPRINKVARAQPIRLAMNKGLFTFSPAVLEKCPILLDEFGKFPWGDHDDIVDGFSAAYLLGHRRPTNAGAYAALGYAGAGPGEARAVTGGGFFGEGAAAASAAVTGGGFAG